MFLISANKRFHSFIQSLLSLFITNDIQCIACVLIVEKQQL